jgi:hypothetical protein
MPRVETVFTQIQTILTGDVLVVMSVASLVFFLGTIVAIPLILVRLPPHYFDERYPRRWLAGHHPVLRLLGLVVKNLVGAIFLAVGVALLFLPGQGILTILIGVSLLDFPGKRSLERRIVGQPAVLGAINTIRARYGRPPLIVKDEK